MTQAVFLLSALVPLLGLVLGQCCCIKPGCSVLGHTAAPPHTECVISVCLQHCRFDSNVRMLYSGLFFSVPCPSQTILENKVDNFGER